MAKIKQSDWKHVFYSPEIDEMFTLNFKPKRISKVYKLWVEKVEMLRYVIYLGEL